MAYIGFHTLQGHYPLSRFVALSQKARTHYGPVNGDDGLFTGVCRLGVPHPSSAPRARSHVPEPKRTTGTNPHGALGIPLLCWNPSTVHAWAVAPGAQSHRGAPAPASAPWKTI